MDSKALFKFIRGCPIIGDPQLKEWILKYTGKKANPRSSGLRLWANELSGSIPSHDLKPKLVVEALNKTQKLIVLNPNDSLVESAITQIRNSIKQKYGADSTLVNKSYKAIFLPKSRKNVMIKNYRAKVSAKSKDKTQLEYHDIKNVVNEILAIPDPRVQDLVILTELAVGSRINEIVEYSGYGLADDEQFITQLRISKVKGGEDRKIIKPVLFITPEQVIRNIQLVRRYEPSTSALIQLVNLRVKKLFGNKHITSSHDLRKIYAVVAYDIHADKKKQTQASYIADILGHSEDILTSAHIYSTIQVNGLDKYKIQQAPDKQIFINPRKRDGRVKEYMVRTISDIISAGLEPSKHLVGKFGYSRRSIVAFYEEALDEAKK